MQYFIGYSSFSNEASFDPSLFVEFRKRLGIDQINLINEKILGLSHATSDPSDENPDDSDRLSDDLTCDESSLNEVPESQSSVTHKGKLITDATACPQDIAYPTDLNLLNDAREKSEELIDKLYDQRLRQAKAASRFARKFVAVACEPARGPIR